MPPDFPDESFDFNRIARSLDQPFTIICRTCEMRNNSWVWNLTRIVGSYHHGIEANSYFSQAKYGVPPTRLYVPWGTGSKYVSHAIPGGEVFAECRIARSTAASECIRRMTATNPRRRRREHRAIRVSLN